MHICIDALVLLVFEKRRFEDKAHETTSRRREAWGPAWTIVDILSLLDFESTDTLPPHVRCSFLLNEETMCAQYPLRDPENWYDGDDN
jgi:hypothetical protein